MIYLDHAAATPVRKEVLAAMQPYFAELFANPSSMHAVGEKAREAIEEAREKVRKILNASVEDKIIFTSGGTESINLALQGVLGNSPETGNFSVTAKKFLITSTIEHEAVLETASALQKKGGCEIIFVGVDSFGKIKLLELEKTLEKVGNDLKKNQAKNQSLLSIMYANNEVGTLQPLQKISQIIKERNEQLPKTSRKILFHTDSCQAGYEELDAHKLGIDLLTLNGSKIYGPKGIGILYVRKGIMLSPIIYGGGQEYSLRSGTENVPAMVGFAKALELAQKEKAKENERLRQLQQMLIKGLLQIPQSKLNGHPTERLANNVNISFAGIEGEQLVRHLSAQGIYCSSGSACTSRKKESVLEYKAIEKQDSEIAMSHVLKAMGVSEKFARGAVRMSLGKETKEKDILCVIQKVKEMVEVLRKVG